MRSQSSALNASRATCIDRLKHRLDTLTQDYAAFFDGFSRRAEYGYKRPQYQSASVLTSLQNLRALQRTPHAPPSSEIFGVMGQPFAALRQFERDWQD